MERIVRLGLRDLEKGFNKTEDDMKALQSVGQIIGEVLKQLREDQCKRIMSMKHLYNKKIIEKKLVLWVSYCESISGSKICGGMSK